MQHLYSMKLAELEQNFKEQLGKDNYMSYEFHNTQIKMFEIKMRKNMSLHGITIWIPMSDPNKMTG